MFHRIRLVPAWLLLGLLVLGARAESESGSCYSQNSGSSDQVQYTISAGPDRTSYSFLVTPASGTNAFAIRLNNDIANNPSLITSASPQGSLQSGFSSLGGPQYIWKVNGTSTQVFSVVLGTNSTYSSVPTLTDLCEQNIEATGPNSSTFTEPPYGPGQAGSCVLFFQTASACTYDVIADKAGYAPALLPTAPANPPGQSPPSPPITVSSPPVSAPVAIAEGPPQASAPLVVLPPTNAAPQSPIPLAVLPPSTPPVAAAPVTQPPTITPSLSPPTTAASPGVTPSIAAQSPQTAAAPSGTPPTASPQASGNPTGAASVITPSGQPVSASSSATGVPPTSATPTSTSSPSATSPSVTAAGTGVVASPTQQPSTSPTGPAVTGASTSANPSSQPVAPAGSPPTPSQTGTTSVSSPESPGSTPNGTPSGTTAGNPSGTPANPTSPNSASGTSGTTAAGSPTTPSTGGAQIANSCQAWYGITASWSANGQETATLNLYVQNSGSQDTPLPVIITFGNPSWVNFVSPWNLDNVQFAGGTVSGQLDPSATGGASLLANNANTANLGGFAVDAGQQTPQGPTSLTVNGVGCSITGS